MSSTLKKVTYVASTCLGAAVLPATAGATTVPTTSQASTASAGLRTSAGSGPTGTVVNVSVGGCDDPVVAFTDGAVREVVPGTASDQPSTDIAQGNFSGSFAIPENAPLGAGIFSTSCKVAAEGAVYAARFVVTSAGSATTAPEAAGASATPQVAGSPSDFVGIASPSSGSGYWLAAADGGVDSFGQVTFYGSEGGQSLNAPMVGIASTKDGKGYWEVGGDGGVFAFGDAVYHGGLGGTQLSGAIVGMAVTADGGGYWLVGSDGAVYAFGDAAFEGSCYSFGGCGTPIVGVAADHASGSSGYWLTGKNGGIFAFGAPYDGGEGGKISNGVAIGATNDGGGYWEVGSDGGVFAFGDATFHGSLVGTTLTKPIDAISPDLATGGYWLMGQDGAVYAEDAPFDGSMTQRVSNAPGTPVAAADGSGSALVTWTAPTNPGLPITSYTVTTAGGTAAVPLVTVGNVLSAVVANLVVGQTYTFTVYATNPNGPGAVSAPSNPFTPVSGPTVQNAPAGSIGFDTDEVVSLAEAQAAVAGGKVFVGRYLSLSPTEQSGDLSISEEQNIASGGLALMVFQHVRNAGWMPSASLGTTDGANAVANANAIKLPAGLDLYADLEGVSPSATAQSVIDYCTAWYAAVSAPNSTYVPGLYVGIDSGLTDTQLAGLPFQHFWKSASTVPPVTGRGYQVIQSTGVQEFGFMNAIDFDTTQLDAQGGVANWVSK